MRPLAIVTGIVLGSCVAITLSLAVVLLIYWIIGDSDPLIRGEIPALRTNSAIFLVLTVAAAAAFYGQLVRRWWRWPALGVLSVLIAVVGVYYWPE
jgi:hypothetical protein